MQLKFNHSVLLAYGLLGLCAAPSLAAVSMTVTVHKISDNSLDTEINWPSVSLPAGWVLASDYIQLDATMNALTDGIQIYTDNLASDANPAYAGTVDATHQTPAGLINTSVRTLKVPTAWTISDDVIPGGPTPANPNGGGFRWFYHEDRSQVANDQRAAPFVDGDLYITVENRSCLGSADNAPCIHYGQSPIEFGSAFTPNYIYMQADFTSAVTPATYKTSTLRLEAFSQ